MVSMQGRQPCEHQSLLQAQRQRNEARAWTKTRLLDRGQKQTGVDHFDNQKQTSQIEIDPNSNSDSNPTCMVTLILTGDSTLARLA